MTWWPCRLVTLSVTPLRHQGRRLVLQGRPLIFLMGGGGGGGRVMMLGTPTKDSLSKAGPKELSPNEIGTSPLKGGESRPKGFSPFSYGLGQGRPVSVRPKEISQEASRTPSFFPKSVLVRENPDLSSTEDRYCPPLPLNYSFSSSYLDRISHLEEFFGHGGIEEISQVSEGSDSVGSQGIALTPLTIFPPSSLRRPLCRELVMVEERDVQ